MINTDREQRIIDFLNNMKKFDKSYYIPSVPKLSKDVYDKYVIPNYIRCGAIPKSELVLNGLYEGNCRNSETAVWKGDHFEYLRTKRGSTFTEEINHFEDDDGYDLFVPIKFIKIV